MHIRSNASRAFLLAAVASATLSSVSSAQELLTNGNFEQGNPGQDGAPGWQTFNFTFTDNQFARTAGGKAFKAYGPFFNIPEAPPGSVGLQTVAATAGTSYTLSGFMFSPTSDRILGSNVGVLELLYLDEDLVPIPGSGQTQLFNASSPLDTWVPYTITSVAPANTASARVVIGHIQINAPVTGGAVWWDDLSLVPTPVPSGSTWIATGSGGWLSASNWSGGNVPNAVGASATFGSSILAPATVSIAGAGATAGSVTFDNASNSYTVAGPGTLTLDVAAGNATLAVVAGTHAVNAPLAVNDTTDATVNGGATLVLGGAVNLSGGSDVIKGGAGTLVFASTATVTGSAGAAVTVNGGSLFSDANLGPDVDVNVATGAATFGATQRVRSLAVGAAGDATLANGMSPRVIRTSTLSIAAGGSLDLTDNGLVIDYSTGTSPAAAIRSLIASGVSSAGASGIVSSVANADGRVGIGYAEASQVGNPTTFLGEAGVDSTTVLVRVTYKGDTDLTGTVAFPDLLALAASYNQTTGQLWVDGDSDYDADVDFTDLLALARNYNATFALTADQLTSLGGVTDAAAFLGDFNLARSLVPEPTTLAAIAAVAVVTRRRRR